MINDFYLRAADLPADTRSLVTEWIEAHPRRLQWAVRRTRQYFGYLDHCSDLTRLAVVLAMLPDTHEKYRQLGIEDTVFADTMSDIGIWCANCGGGGLHNVHWIKNHLDARLFRLGRLQFQLYRLPPVAAYPRTAPLTVGAPVVYIHIPQGAPLETEACRLSIARARAFFDQVFPDYAYTCFFSESWLLFSGNKNFMRPGCNILQFAALFHPVCDLPFPAQTMERVFGAKCRRTEDYPEETDLQRRLKAYLLAGGQPGMGVGYIER